jgi:hypothetical protein
LEADTGHGAKLVSAPGRPARLNRKVVGVFPHQAKKSRQRLFEALEHVFPVRFEERADGQWAGLCGALVFGAENRAQAAPCPVFLMPDRAEAGGRAREIEFSSEPVLDKRLRGRRLAESSALDMSTAQFLPGDAVLASAGGAPVWVRRAHGGRWYDVAVTAPSELVGDETLRETLVPGRWLATLPVIHFLREIAGDDAWAGPAPRAAFVFDDPNLHTTRYGHIKFKELVSHARRHGYHAVFASIPLDYRFASPRAAELFRENADVVSLCVHGNNHVADELSRVESEQDAMVIAAQALRRSADLEARTGIEISRVMVPPHEACSERMMRGLLRVGFESICLESPFHRRCGVSTPPAWALAEWYAGDFAAGGLTTIPRYPLDRARDELVLRAFLDQPLVLYGHHRDVAAGLDVLAAAHDYVAGFGAVAWSSLRAISRSNCMTLRQGSRLHVRPLSRYITLTGLEDVEELVVDVPETASAIAVRVRSEGASWQALTSDSTAFRPPHEGPVTIALIPADLVSPESVAAPQWRPWPVARRIITETRDRTSPLLRRL